MSWHPNPTASTAVYGAAATVNAWTNLDVSAVVGAQEVWVLFTFEQTAGASVFVPAVRQDGSALQYYDAVTHTHGGTRASQAAGTRSVSLAILTSAAGIVEWCTNTVANTCKIYVDGWLDITTDGTNLLSGAFPAAWTEKDASGIVGANRALLIMEWHRTGGTQNTMSLRPADEAAAADWLVAAGNASGPNQDGNTAINIYSSPLMMTDDAGKFDYIAEAVVPNGTLDMLAYALAQTPTNADVFAAAAPPLAWTDLDLTTGPSGATGLPAVECLVMLRVHREAIAGSTSVSFRTNGVTFNLMGSSSTRAKGCASCYISNDDITPIVLQTDASGVVEWIADVNAANIDVEIVGWIPGIDPPVLSNGSPSGATVNDITGTFGFDIYADTNGPGIDLSTLEVQVLVGGGDIDPIKVGVLQTANGWEAPGQIPADGANVGSVLLTYYSGATAPYRWPWLATSSFYPVPPGTYDCYADVDDHLGQSATQLAWTFTVTSPGPTTTGVTPTGVLVANNAPLQFTIAAPLLGSGDIALGEQRPIDQSTVNLDLTDPALAVHNAIVAGVFQTGYAGTFTSDGLNGYTVDLTTHPTWANGVWSATADGDDSEGDNDSDTWGWTVVGDPPSISNEHPIDTTLEVTSIGCRLSDSAGFNVATLSMTVTPVDSSVPLTAITGGVFQTGWAGIIYESDDPGTGPREIDIEITTWPDLGNGKNVVFEVTITNINGLVL